MPTHSVSTFSEDIVRGEEEEERIHLNLLNYSKYKGSSRSKGYDPYADIYFKDKTPAVEVKADFMSEETEMVGVEYLNNNGQPSGVRISKAPLWIFVLQGFGDWVIWLDELKQLLAAHNFETVPSKEGSRLELVPRYEFFRWAKKIDWSEKYCIFGKLEN